MTSPIKFKIEKKLSNGLGRAGTLLTPHGKIETPAFVTVGTKGTVKALSPDQVDDLGAQVVLANTYHLYLQPGHELISKAGGLNKFMNWSGPTMTDSGGFQVFSLGYAFGKGGVSKVATTEEINNIEIINPNEVEEPNALNCARSTVERTGSDEPVLSQLAKIDEDGVTFKSHIDGSTHRFTPESSIEIQQNIGADMIFAFDECTSPLASYEYQREAMDRTHRWAKRSLEAHRANKEASEKQALFGIVQGGRFKDLREESAREISKMGFDGFGIGGSFNKEDMYTSVGWVNQILPEELPRHLLGIGEPMDLFGGVESGADLFDCVAPTRMARNGSLHTKDGRINITNAKYTNDLTPIESDCGCYTCRNYTSAYLSHLFRAKEMLASTLASIHNLYFIVGLVKKIRQSILDDKFAEFKEEFLRRYYK